MDINEFYDQNPERRESEEIEFGFDWRDSTGKRHQLVWVAATGELYTIADGDPPGVELLGVVETRSRLEDTLAGWQIAMDEPDSVTWVLDRLAGLDEPAGGTGQRAIRPLSPGAEVNYQPSQSDDPLFGVLLTLAMATVTVVLVVVVGLLLDFPNVIAAAIGCFLAMTIMVGFTSQGREMSENLQIWHSTRAAIGRPGLRESRRAIKEGRAVDDAALAPYTIRIAERSRLVLARSVPWWWYALAAVLLVLSIVNANVVGAVVFGLALVSMPALRYFNRGRLEKVERSIAANRQLLDAP